jgi:hypothetical protein
MQEAQATSHVNDAPGTGGPTKVTKKMQKVIKVMVEENLRTSLCEFAEFSRTGLTYPTKFWTRAWFYPSNSAF